MLVVTVHCGADEEAEADLERAKREIEQLKVDRDVAVEKKEKQVCKLHPFPASHTPLVNCVTFRFCS